MVVRSTIPSFTSFLNDSDVNKLDDCVPVSDDMSGFHFLALF